MFIGHFGLALAAKKLAPRTSLGTLLFATQFADLIWPILLLLGIEHVRIAPGITRMTPLDFYDYPISHSLLALAVCSAVVGGAYYLFTRYTAGALGCCAGNRQPLVSRCFDASCRYALMARRTAYRNWTLELMDCGNRSGDPDIHCWDMDVSRPDASEGCCWTLRCLGFDDPGIHCLDRIVSIWTAAERDDGRVGRIIDVDCGPVGMVGRQTSCDSRCLERLPRPSCRLRKTPTSLDSQG